MDGMSHNFCIRSEAFLKKRGFSLVELLVAMTILAFVFCWWLNIANIKPVSKESMRYSATEEAAGLLDAAAALNSPVEGLYVDNGTNGLVRVAALSDTRVCRFLSADDAAPGYRLSIERRPAAGSAPAGMWARIALYDSPEADPTSEKPFSEFSLFLGK